MSNSTEDIRRYAMDVAVKKCGGDNIDAGFLVEQAKLIENYICGLVARGSATITVGSGSGGSASAHYPPGTVVNFTN